MFLPEPVLKASIEAIDSGIDERISRLKALAAKIPESIKDLNLVKKDNLSEVIRQQQEFYKKWPEVEDKLNTLRNFEGDLFLKQDFLSNLPTGSSDYIETIHSLNDITVRVGISWLSSITSTVETGINALLPAFS